jgi:hypothetical protein
MNVLGQTRSNIHDFYTNYPTHLLCATQKNFHFASPYGYFWTNQVNIHDFYTNYPTPLLCATQKNFHLASPGEPGQTFMIFTPTTQTPCCVQPQQSEQQHTTMTIEVAVFNPNYWVATKQR